MSKSKKIRADTTDQTAAKTLSRANAKVIKLYEKLCVRLRARAVKGLERSRTAAAVNKQVAGRKAFEVFGNAASEVEQRVAEMRALIGGQL